MARKFNKSTKKRQIRPPNYATSKKKANTRGSNKQQRSNRLSTAKPTKNDQPNTGRSKTVKQATGNGVSRDNGSTGKPKKPETRSKKGNHTVENSNNDSFSNISNESELTDEHLSILFSHLKKENNLQNQIFLKHYVRPSQVNNAIEICYEYLESRVLEESEISEISEATKFAWHGQIIDYLTKRSCYVEHIEEDDTSFSLLRSHIDKNATRRWFCHSRGMKESTLAKKPGVPELYNTGELRKRMMGSVRNWNPHHSNGFCAFLAQKQMMDKLTSIEDVDKFLMREIYVHGWTKVLIDAMDKLVYRYGGDGITLDPLEDIMGGDLISDLNSEFIVLDMLRKIKDFGIVYTCNGLGDLVDCAIVERGHRRHNISQCYYENGRKKSGDKRDPTNDDGHICWLIHYHTSPFSPTFKYMMNQIALSLETEIESSAKSCKPKFIYIMDPSNSDVVIYQSPELDPDAEDRLLNHHYGFMYPVDGIKYVSSKFAGGSLSFVAAEARTFIRNSKVVVSTDQITTGWKTVMLDPGRIQAYRCVIVDLPKNGGIKYKPEHFDFSKSDDKGALNLRLINGSRPLEKKHIFMTLSTHMGWCEFDARLDEETKKVIIEEEYLDEETIKLMKEAFENCAEQALKRYTSSKKGIGSYILQNTIAGSSGSDPTRRNCAWVAAMKIIELFRPTLAIKMKKMMKKSPTSFDCLPITKGSKNCNDSFPTSIAKFLERESIQLCKLRAGKKGKQIKNCEEIFSFFSDLKNNSGYYICGLAVNANAGVTHVIGVDLHTRLIYEPEKENPTHLCVSALKDCLGGDDNIVVKSVFQVIEGHNN